MWITHPDLLTSAKGLGPVLPGIGARWSSNESTTPIVPPAPFSSSTGNTSSSTRRHFRCGPAPEVPAGIVSTEWLAQCPGRRRAARAWLSAALRNIRSSSIRGRGFFVASNWAGSASKKPFSASNEVSTQWIKKLKRDEARLMVYPDGLQWTGVAYSRASAPTVIATASQIDTIGATPYPDAIKRH